MALYLTTMIRLVWGSEGGYSLYNIINSQNDTSRSFLVLGVEIISTLVSVVVVVVVVGGLFRGSFSSCSSRRLVPR
jgi:hypothetical protein